MTSLTWSGKSTNCSLSFTPDSESSAFESQSNEGYTATWQLSSGTLPLTDNWIPADIDSQLFAF